MLRVSYPVIKIPTRSLLSASSKYEHNVHMPYAVVQLLSAWKANKAMCRNDEWCVAYDRTATTLPPPSLPSSPLPVLWLKASCNIPGFAFSAFCAGSGRELVQKPQCRIAAVAVTHKRKAVLLLTFIVGYKIWLPLLLMVYISVHPPVGNSHTEQLAK